MVADTHEPCLALAGAFAHSKETLNAAERLIEALEVLNAELETGGSASPKLWEDYRTARLAYGYLARGPEFV